MPINKISAVIITKNEEKIIEGCLKSLKWVDEIILVDCGSTDKTINIAKKYTKSIYRQPWKGFPEQRNYGISKAKGDWIISIDADERVSKKLEIEITSTVKKNPHFSAFAIRRYNIFLGKLMLHGGWNPDYPIRLFKKTQAYFNENQRIHEELVVKGNLGKMENPLYHLSHRDISSNLIKTREYAILSSKEMFDNNYPRVTEINLITSMISHFFNRYIRAKGYKDGMEGLIEAIYQSFSQKFIIQAMLWERQKGNNSKNLYDSIDKKILQDKYE